MSEGKLKKLLDKLKERQSWCPCCGGESVHDYGCVLEGHWFRSETEDDGVGEEDE